MKIGMIDGSPKVKDSCTKELLLELNRLITEGNELIKLSINSNRMDTTIYDKLYGCDAIVIAMPLYMDGVPSHLLCFMEEMQRFLRQREAKKIFVYTIINNGFYEGRQTDLANQIVENWCEKVGLPWGMGIGVGSGSMVMSVKSVPLGRGPKKNLGIALNQLAKRIANQESAENIYVNLNFPRFLYILAAHQGWRYAVKQNGLKKKDLYRQCKSSSK